MYTAYPCTNIAAVYTQTLSECDIKCDKDEVQKVLSSIPQLEEIEDYQFQPINIDPVKKLLEGLTK